MPEHHGNCPKSSQNYGRNMFLFIYLFIYFLVSVGTKWMANCLLFCFFFSKHFKIILLSLPSPSAQKPVTLSSSQVTTSAVQHCLLSSIHISDMTSAAWSEHLLDLHPLTPFQTLFKKYYFSWWNSHKCTKRTKVTTCSLFIL